MGILPSGERLCEDVQEWDLADVNITRVLIDPESEGGWTKEGRDFELNGADLTELLVELEEKEWARLWFVERLEIEARVLDVALRSGRHPDRSTASVSFVGFGSSVMRHLPDRITREASRRGSAYSPRDGRTQAVLAALEDTR
jgi:hypothetical protein